MPTSDPVAIPDLRILASESLLIHEAHDEQRSAPLLERLRGEEYIINPLLVAPLDEGRFVVLDGTNRCHALRALGFAQLPAQVVSHASGQITLDTWSHVVSDWTTESLIDSLAALDLLRDSSGSRPLAQLSLADGRQYTIAADPHSEISHNAQLRQLVATYQGAARLYRTPLRDFREAQAIYPQALALLNFSHLTYTDVLAAARDGDLLPPGLSRHIVQGRALRVMFPIARLRDTSLGLEKQNCLLRERVRDMLARRQLRYYAEATWMFDE